MKVEPLNIAATRRTPKKSPLLNIPALGTATSRINGETSTSFVTEAGEQPVQAEDGSDAKFILNVVLGRA
jgi:hypothetical protein